MDFCAIIVRNFSVCPQNYSVHLTYLRTSFHDKVRKNLSVIFCCERKSAKSVRICGLFFLPRKSSKICPQIFSIHFKLTFDSFLRIHLQHDHLCNIAKFYQSLKEASTNLATGNISFEMAKDFITRCQTCTINSQQKSSKTTQNSGLFAPKLSPTKFPKKNARPEISPILANGASNSGGNGKSDGAKNGSKNGFYF